MIQDILLSTENINLAEIIASKHNDQGLLGLALNVKWHPHVKNGHSCPHNGVTNWSSRNNKLPTGYPGWQGRVWILYRSSKEKSISPFELRSSPCGLNTGTGGGALYDCTEWNYDFGYPCGYDCKIFDSDHPEIYQALGDLEEQYNLELFEMKIKNNSYKKPDTHRQYSVWKHPDLIRYQKEQDLLKIDMPL